MTEPAVQVTDLVKRHGELEAARGISFQVQPGETFGFLGPNGAGKSTTTKILCTLADPASGSARVAGRDVRRERDTVRRNIGLVFQDPTPDSYLAGEQTCASMPTGTACPARSLPRGCGLSSTWSTCGTAATPR